MASQEHRHTLAVSVSEDAEASSWDKFVASSPGGHHVQTSLWAQVKASRGLKPVRVTVRQGGEIVGGAQVLLRQLGFGRAAAYVAKGPLVAGTNPTVPELILDSLSEMTKHYRIEHLTVQPPDNGESLIPKLERRGFVPSFIEVAPTATVRIDLRPSPDELLAAMKRNNRRYIRHGMRRGLVSRLGTHGDLRIFHDLLKMTARRQRFTPFDLDYYETIWRLFEPRGYVAIVVTELEDEPVCAQLIIPFRDTVITKSAGWSGKYSSLGPNYVMDWATILWARETGYHWLDLEGIEREVAELRVRGEPLPAEMRQTASFHKLGFGGELALLPRAYSRASNPVFRWGERHVLARLNDRLPARRLVNLLRTG